MIEDGGLKIFWDGHASIRADDKGFTVAVDPYRPVSPDFEADIILVTHQDSGHFDPELIEEISTPRTVLLLPEAMRDVEVPVEDVEYLGIGERIDIYNVEIEGVPMCNEYHERGQGLGYRFVMAEKSFYVAGDTGMFDEVMDLEGRVDYAFLPIEGEYTMDIEEASSMAVKIKPRVTVPYHYGEPFFDEEDVDLRGFKAELERRNLECRTLKED